MNVILRRITNKAYNADTDFIRIKEGNYKVVRSTRINSIRHFYFDNLICYVDVERKYFYLYLSGFENKKLIISQLNFLEEFYRKKGYRLVYREFTNETIIY